MTLNHIKTLIIIKNIIFWKDYCYIPLYKKAGIQKYFHFTAFIDPCHQSLKPITKYIYHEKIKFIQYIDIQFIITD